MTGAHAGTTHTEQAAIPDTAMGLPVTRHMTYGQMRRACDTLPVRIMSHPLPGDTCAVYDGDLQAIVLDRNMTYVQKRCSLVHELFHWLHGDDTCAGTTGGRMEWRARKHTALLLVDGDEYARAEEACDGNPYLMACELDVTVQVVDDYRRILHDNGR